METNILQFRPATPPPQPLPEVLTGGPEVLRNLTDDELTDTGKAIMATGRGDEDALYWVSEVQREHNRRGEAYLKHAEELEQLQKSKSGSGAEV